MPIQVEYNGVVHEFPDDFSDADIQAALSQADQPPEKSLSGFVSNIGSNLGNIIGGAVKNINSAVDQGFGRKPLETINPAAQSMAASNARAFGQDRTAPERTMDEALNEAYQQPVSTALTLSGGMTPRLNLRPVKAGAMRGGVNVVRRAQKAPVSTLNKMAGVKQMGLDVAAEKVARTELSERLPMRHGAARTQGVIDEAVQARDAAIEAAPGLPVKGSGMAQFNALREPMQKARSQRLPEADVAAVSGLGREMMRNPKLTIRSPTAGRTREPLDLTPRELNALNKGDNAALSDAYGARKSSAELGARKAVAASGRESIEQGVPGTRGQGRRINDLINLRNVQNMAGRRANARDAVGLTDIIGVASGHPSTLLASTAMRPAVQDLLGHGLYRTGAALPGTLDLTPALRALILQQLLTAPEESGQR